MVAGAHVGGAVGGRQATRESRQCAVCHGGSMQARGRERWLLNWRWMSEAIIASSLQRLQHPLRHHAPHYAGSVAGNARNAGSWLCIRGNPHGGHRLRAGRLEYTPPKRTPPQSDGRRQGRPPSWLIQRHFIRVLGARPLARAVKVSRPTAAVLPWRRLLLQTLRCLRHNLLRRRHLLSVALQHHSAHGRGAGRERAAVGQSHGGVPVLTEPHPRKVNGTVSARGAA
mmetsp:Transcript_11696/g.21092  ORF Transcript_11696/g.21092 Transcript_11696/m.21092 type:complete len:227 (-) Transcript_11696:1744-2424(-)